MPMVPVGCPFKKFDEIFEKFSNVKNKIVIVAGYQGVT